jgi:hypothetical protein
MQITVVVVMCHMLESVPQPVCREEIIVKGDMPMHVCEFSQPALAEWKAQSIYRGNEWTISRIKCIPGDYVIKEAA